MPRNPNIIPLSDCKDRHLYIIDARNASIGIFHKSTGSFIISRFKGGNYLFNENHYDHTEGFGTAIPLVELEEVPYVSEEEELRFLNRREEELEKRIEEIKQKITKG